MEVIRERFDLALERIRQISMESMENQALDDYFQSVAKFILLLEDNRQFIERGGLQTAPIEELRQRNAALYADVMPDRYENSYANPTYAVAALGEEYGQSLSVLYAEIRRMISYIYRGMLEDFVIGMELFSEIHAEFSYGTSEGDLPSRDRIRDILYWYSSDYADRKTLDRVRQMVCPVDNYQVDIIVNSDLNDVRYLFAYGLYVGENEEQTARYLASLPEETIALMANTYTEGFRMGFEVTGKDLSKKTSVMLAYHIGFERMLRAAIDNFAKLNLAPVIWDGYVDGGTFNRQYGYDHKDDVALFLDRKYMNRRLEVLRTAYEQYKTEANGHAGPALIETFGEAEFQPVNKKERVTFSEEQNKLYVELLSKNSSITREYIIPEERSFTIIAFPIPEVGDVFEELFSETIKLNTLDYMLYRNVQQKLIALHHLDCPWRPADLQQAPALWEARCW